MAKNFADTMSHPQGNTGKGFPKNENN